MWSDGRLRTDFEVYAVNAQFLKDRHKVCVSPVIASCLYLLPQIQASVGCISIRLSSNESCFRNYVVIIKCELSYCAKIPYPSSLFNWKFCETFILYKTSRFYIVVERCVLQRWRERKNCFILIMETFLQRATVSVQFEVEAVFILRGPNCISCWVNEHCIVQAEDCLGWEFGWNRMSLFF